MSKYSPEFKESIIAKMLPPNAQSVNNINLETGIPIQTLHKWKSKATKQGIAAVASPKNASQWSDEAKVAIIVETAPLNSAELNEYCRAKGLYPEQIQQWRAAAVSGQSKALSKTEREEFQKIKKRCKALEKELARKEKALAETAALMVLRKKANAIWGEPEGE